MSDFVVKHTLILKSEIHLNPVLQVGSDLLALVPDDTLTSTQPDLDLRRPEKLTDYAAKRGLVVIQLLPTATKGLLIGIFARQTTEGQVRFSSSNEHVTPEFKQVASDALAASLDMDGKTVLGVGDEINYVTRQEPGDAYPLSLRGMLGLLRCGVLKL